LGPAPAVSGARAAWRWGSAGRSAGSTLGADSGYRLVSVMSKELCHRLRRSNEDLEKLMTAIAIAIAIAIHR